MDLFLVRVRRRLQVWVQIELYQDMDPRLQSFFPFSRATHFGVTLFLDLHPIG